MFDIDKFELDLWDKELKKLNRMIDEVQNKLDNDPNDVIIDCNLQFSKLLETHKGKERLTPEFDRKVQSLAKKEKLAKRRAKTYSLTANLEEFSDLKLKRDMVEHKYNTLLYSKSWRKK